MRTPLFRRRQLVRGSGARCLVLVLMVLTGSPQAADTPVADAAQRGDTETVRRLLRQGADVNGAHGDGMSALHWAADRGDEVLGQLLIYAGANVDAGTRLGSYTPLHLAARQGRVAMVKTLLAAKSNPHAITTNSGTTPLHLAAASGQPEAVAELLLAGAQVDAVEARWGQTPLMFAAAAGRVEAIQVLLGAGADPSITSVWVDAAEREEADRAAEKRLSEFLTDFRKKEGGGPQWKPTPSQVQAAIQAARQIQEKWPDVPRPGQEEEKAPETEPSASSDNPIKTDSESDEAGQPENPPADAGERESDPAPTTPRPVAAPTVYNAEGEPVTQPIAGGKGADDEPRPLSYGQMVGGWGGLTPLLHSVRQGHTAAALALLEGGAEIDQTAAGDQTTPLLMAALNGQFDLALTLIKRGADPNLASAAGATPLFAVLERTWAPRASYAHPTEHQQQRTTHLELVEALLEAGADPNARLKKHLWYSEYTFGVLRRAGIDLAGATPFWRAAYALDLDAMRLLKQYGADPHIPTIKPPERRRRSPMEKPEEKVEKPAGTEENVETNSPSASELSDTAPAIDTDPSAPNPSSTEAKKVETDEDEEEEDHSGIPPVPVGGPALYPLHAAAGAGYGQSFAGNAHRHVPDNWLATVRFLIEECGAEVDIRDANAYTALHHAASRGDNELILYLVEKGADVTALSRKGQTTADMANGPIERVPPYPSTIELLEKLGSKNNHNCKSC